MRFRPATYFTLVIAVFFALALVTALQWPLRASILVLTLGSVTLVLCLVQVYLEVRRGSDRSDDPSGMDIAVDESQRGRAALKRTIDIWAWILGAILAIWLAGFQIAIPLFAFLYPLTHGSRWYIALVICFVSFAALWGIFEMIISVPWPEPFLLGFFRGS
ncbi:MAG: tripartite tricarboxylate transporter TctB family protein [Chloroflexi bacterium]|nr:tripartite tricarboxylate transporter TctB family protein [Chloroflexota bacterium]